MFFDGDLNKLSYNIPDGLKHYLIIQCFCVISASKFAFTTELVQAALQSSSLMIGQKNGVEIGRRKQAELKRTCIFAVGTIVGWTEFSITASFIT